MKPLILSFFAVLLGYSLFFDKDEDVKLQNFEQASSEIQSVVSSHTSDSVTLYAKKTSSTPDYILQMTKPDESLFMK